MDDLKSQKSMKSQVSRLSAASRKSKRTGVADDARSVAASVVSSTMSIDEQDEWTAIQKFNALLHYQEQKQAAER